MLSGLDLRLQSPFSCVVNGPSGSGKTEWIRKLIFHRDQIITPVPQKIIWCYRIWQPAYADLIDKVEFVKGLNYHVEPHQDTLLILDDMMMHVNQQVVELFIAGRHDRISVIFVTHNLFYKAPEMRTIALNTRYMVLFKNVRDATQIQTLARQMFPGKTKHVLEAYQDATSRPYGYLLLDFQSQTPGDLRLRTSIFPGENQFVYAPL